MKNNGEKLKKNNFKQLTICIPVFNEEKAIKKVITELKSLFIESEIIVVDDGSNDNTFDIISNIPDIKIIRNYKNMGYGYSLKRAIKVANGEYVAWFDGDGQHNPEDLKKMYEEMIKNNYDVVIGSRRKCSHKVKRRILGKFILKFFAQLIVGQKIPDLNSGLRIFKKEIILKYLHLLPDGFSASSTSTVLMHKKGYYIKYADIKTNQRKGKSSVNIIKDGFRSLKLLFNLLILFEAFNFFLILSLLQILPGLTYGLYVALRYKRGFPVFAAVLLITGFFTFFIGILAEQITALRKDKFE